MSQCPAKNPNGKRETKFYFIESIPTECTFPDGTKIYKTTADAIVRRLVKAKKSIDAISLYYTLRDKDVEDGPYPSAAMGEKVYTELENAARRGVKIHLLSNKKSDVMQDNDLTDLKKEFPSQVDIGYIDMSDKTKGYTGGICHTKLWLIDDLHFYVGSSNMDWRSYSEIVETGIMGKHCPTTLSKLRAIFNYSCKLAGESVPSSGNGTNPTSSEGTGIDVIPDEPVVVSSSPNLICEATDTPNDVNALLHIIETATENLYVSTYEYATGNPFSTPPIYDSKVQDAIIKAAKERNVKVHLLFDIKCVHSKALLKNLFILSKIPNITVKVFKINKTPEKKIPYARLWHSKCAINDTKLWISTNNIDPSYFVLTCGIGILLDSTKEISYNIKSVLKHATKHFLRYWDSEYVFKFEPHFTEVDLVF